MPYGRRRRVRVGPGGSAILDRALAAIGPDTTAWSALHGLAGCDCGVNAADGVGRRSQGRPSGGMDHCGCRWSTGAPFELTRADVTMPLQRPSPHRRKLVLLVGKGMSSGDRSLLTASGDDAGTVTIGWPRTCEQRKIIDERVRTSAGPDGGGPGEEVHEPRENGRYLRRFGVGFARS